MGNNSRLKLGWVIFLIQRHVALCVPSAESSRSVRGLRKGVSGKPYPRLCNARRPQLDMLLSTFSEKKSWIRILWIWVLLNTLSHLFFLNSDQTYMLLDIHYCISYLFNKTFGQLDNWELSIQFSSPFDGGPWVCYCVFHKAFNLLFISKYHNYFNLLQVFLKYCLLVVDLHFVLKSSIWMSFLTK